MRWFRKKKTHDQTEAAAGGSRIRSVSRAINGWSVFKVLAYGGGAAAGATAVALTAPASVPVLALVAGGAVAPGVPDAVRSVREWWKDRRKAKLKPDDGSLRGELRGSLQAAITAALFVTLVTLTRTRINVEISASSAVAAVSIAYALHCTVDYLLPKPKGPFRGK